MLLIIVIECHCSELYQESPAAQGGDASPGRPDGGRGGLLRRRRLRRPPRHRPHAQGAQRPAIHRRGTPQDGHTSPPGMGSVVKIDSEILPIFIH